MKKNQDTGKILYNIEIEERINSMWERNISRIDKMAESDDLAKQAYVNGFWFYAALVANENRIRKKLIKDLQA